ncbi:hypothetical protein NW766_001674 [Fusarium irregulare]|uniref:Uncharacterized protein n=1 Tax=Fusarium irregulare TaxID=2494466 RepID=A0A9W8PYP4_9HYPO|nr:hypothetical protein NW766_001674 [Fusarium irregulare]
MKSHWALCDLENIYKVIGYSQITGTIARLQRSSTSHAVGCYEYLKDYHRRLLTHIAQRLYPTAPQSL